MFSRPSSLWGWLMCNALNGVVIAVSFIAISSRFGVREDVWHLILTLAIIASTVYSANYFTALEARKDRRRFLLFPWVLLNMLFNLQLIW